MNALEMTAGRARIQASSSCCWRLFYHNEPGESRNDFGCPPGERRRVHQSIKAFVALGEAELVRRVRTRGGTMMVNIDGGK